MSMYPHHGYATHAQGQIRLEKARHELQLAAAHAAPLVRRMQELLAEAGWHFRTCADELQRRQRAGEEMERSGVLRTRAHLSEGV